MGATEEVPPGSTDPEEWSCHDFCLAELDEEGRGGLIEDTDDFTDAFLDIARHW